MIIGLTGGIGSGKSTVAKILGEHGAEIILADKVAREVVEPGMPAYQQIVDTFGKGILCDSGHIDRKKLGDIVFADPKLLKVLNGLTHSATAAKIKQELELMKGKGAQIIVVEAVVPVKQGFLDLVDTVWVVLADEPVRVKRIMERNHYTKKEAKQRIRAQMSDEMYISHAGQIVYNNGTIDDLKEKISEVLYHENQKS